MTEFSPEKLKKKSDSFRKTAYIRFDLAERLQQINYINLVISIMLTVYLSGWAIFITFFPDTLTPHNGKVISFVSVMATVALMCLTILDYTADRSVKSKLFLQNGNRILGISEELDFAVASNQPITVVKKIIDGYYTEISSVDSNHSGEDYELYTKKTKSSASWGDWLCFKYSLLSYFIKRLFLQVIVIAVITSATAQVICSTLRTEPSVVTLSPAFSPK